jgi:hypothetical protein
MVHVLLTLNKASELGCKRIFKMEADIRKAMEGLHPTTGEQI